MVPPWLVPALAALGEREVPGALANPLIGDMHEAVDGERFDDEVPWCSAFALWALVQTGLPRPGGVTRLARSWLRADGLATLEAPSLGCLAVLRRGQPWQGHVGFVVGSTPGCLVVLGGNQGEGGEVSIRPYSESLALGFRWPLAFERRQPL